MKFPNTEAKRVTENILFELEKRAFVTPGLRNLIYQTIEHELEREAKQSRGQEGVAA